MSSMSAGSFGSSGPRQFTRSSLFAKAACLGLPGDMFFAGEDRAGIATTLRAKAVCAGCDIVEACRAWAMENNEGAGVWGGLTTTERDTLRTRSSIVAFCAS